MAHIYPRGGIAKKQRIYSKKNIALLLGIKENDCKFAQYKF